MYVYFTLKLCIGQALFMVLCVKADFFPGYKKLSHCFFPPKLLVPAEEESESCGRVQENKM